MSRQAAQALLVEEIQRYRSRTYEELLRLRTEVDDYELVGPSGILYGIEVNAFWDSGKPGDLRVIMAIDGGEVSAGRPISEGFIISPDGSFVGE